jgi:hypothetical protein
MNSAGKNSYLGTIPATQLSAISNVSYYIEATDALDASAETPWYTVRFQGQTDAETAVAAPQEWSWKKTALVGGAGAAALVGGIALAGGGGGGGEGGTTTTNAGTYVGSVSTTLELDGSAPTTTTHAVTFTVFSAGLVSSDTLQEGQHLEARLTGGGDFEMVADISTPGLTGRIRYLGHLINTRITGNIDGTARTSDGVPGTYSGTFSAVKR